MERDGSIEKEHADGALGGNMSIINFDECQARRLIDSLFAANATEHGEICEWPVVGGHYVSGEDPIEETKELAVRALLARNWFADNGPADAQPLPLSYDEREDMKGGRGLLYYILALYARSLEGRDYDLEEHPSFPEYVGGVLWEAEQVDGLAWLPGYPNELPRLRKRYPPAMLIGMGPGLCWEPPEVLAQRLKIYRSSFGRLPPHQIKRINRERRQRKPS